jgi:hypothetical protein
MREARRDEVVGEPELPAEQMFEEPSSAPAFAARGVIPPVSEFGGEAHEQIPSPSDRAYGQPLYDQPTVKAPKNEVAAPPPPSAFDGLSRGVKEKDAPSAIRLPEAARAGLETAWSESKGGTPDEKEHGGNLVRDKHNQYAWREGGKGKGDAFMPDEDDVDKDQTLVSFGHTHPYKSGEENVSFSGDDIAGIIDEKPKIELLISGKTFFVIAKTREFDKMLDDLDQEQFDALRTRISDYWTKIYNADPKLSIAVRAETATVATCKQFHLLYYRGDGGALKREA